MIDIWRKPKYCVINNQRPIKGGFMSRKLTQEQFIDKLCEKYNISSESFEISKYRGWDKPIDFTCNLCGVKKRVIASSLTRKTKYICKCYNFSEEWHKKRKAFQNWLETQNNFEILEDFSGLRKNLRVRCKKCKAEQKRSVDSLIKNQGCQICELKQGKRKTHKQFCKEIEELYGEEYEVLTEYKTAYEPVLLRHNLCGKIYKTKPHNILMNKGGHCPICGIKSKGEKQIINFLEKNKIRYEQQKRLPQFKKAPYDFYLPDFNLLIEYQGIQHFQPVDKFGGKPTFLRQQEIDKEKKRIAFEENFNFLEIKYTQYEEIEILLAQRLFLRGSNEK